MASSVIVSVRFAEVDLQKLQLLAQIYGRSVGQLIRDAADKHIKKLTGTKEFKIKGLRLQRQNEKMLQELLEVAGVSNTESK